MKIIANTLVKDEERFLWYSVESIIEHIDKILLWDTGSTDSTLEIIEEIRKKHPTKVDFKEKGNVDEKQFSEVRQEMLDKSEGDWIFVHDGDEVWWEDSINKTIEEIGRGDCDAIVSPFTNPLGDLFHFQEKSAGRYNIDGKVGNLTIRAFKKNIPGLKVMHNYGREGYIDSTGEFIQESGQVKRRFVDVPFLHLTHLTRSFRDFDVMQRSPKKKYETGLSFPLDYYYPEVFFRHNPVVVESPWKTVDRNFKTRAFLETPLKKLKRRI